MDIATPGALALLALVDSTSFGTLLIPVWLLMTPGRLRLGRILLFLLTVALAYLSIGVVLLLGASSLTGMFESARASNGFLVAQLVLGVGLVVLSCLMDTKEARARAAERAATGGGRLGRWRARAMGGSETPGGGTVTAAGSDGRGSSHTTVRTGSPGALIALALTAVVLELATMLPYLAAIGIITTSSGSWPESIALLVGYCLVMIAPALVLTAGRLVAHGALERPLAVLDAWLTKNARSTTAWIIGIVGVLLGVNALGDLGGAAGLFELLDGVPR